MRPVVSMELVQRVQRGFPDTPLVPVPKMSVPGFPRGKSLRQEGGAKESHLSPPTRGRQPLIGLDVYGRFPGDLGVHNEDTLIPLLHPIKRFDTCVNLRSAIPM